MTEDSVSLPGSRKEAGKLACESAFIRDIIPEELIRKYMKK